MGNGQDGKRQKMLMIGGGVLIIVLALTTVKSFSQKSPFEAATGQMESMLRKGDYAGALVKAQSRLALAEETFEEDAPQISDSYHDIGAVLAAAGKYIEAKRWVLKSINQEMSARGEKSASLPEKLVTLAEVSQGLGNNSEAEKYGAKATEIFKSQSQAKRFTEQVKAYAVTASAALAQNACDRALTAALGGFSLADKVGRETDLMQSLNTSAGRAEYCLNHPDKAEPYIKDAIQLAKKGKKYSDPELPVLTSLQGDLLCAMGKCKQGSKYHNDAFKLAKKMFGESDPKTLAYQAKAEESSAKPAKKSKRDEIEEDRTEIEPAALPIERNHFENF